MIEKRQIRRDGHKIRIKIGRLVIWLSYKPATFTSLWKGGKIAISIMWETERLRIFRQRIRGDK